MAIGNIQTFLDACFANNRPRRLTQAIQNAVAHGDKTAFIISAGDLNELVNRLVQGWEHPGSVVCPQSDRDFLAFLRAYVQANQMALWVPHLTINGMHNNLPRYRLHWYYRYEFQDAHHVAVRPTVEMFLRLFLSGAHFVIVHSWKDLGTARPDFYGSAAAPTPAGSAISPTTPIVDAPLHSHYSGGLGPVPLGNLVSLAKGKGIYYPHLNIGEQAPNPSPFIASLLIGPTAHSSLVFSNVYNTFFQLEGWPGTHGFSSGAAEVAAYKISKAVTFGYYPSGLTRHMQDFEVHAETKWNISTFGASVYSEKRGTTVFVAPRDWVPLPAPGSTVMAPYYGATTRQKWLDTNLISADYAAPAGFSPL